MDVSGEPQQRECFAVTSLPVENVRISDPSKPPRRKPKRRPKGKSVYTKNKKRRFKAVAKAVEDHPDRVLTFAQWCAINAFSKDTGRRILKGKCGPRPPVVHLTAKRIGIRVRDNLEWQRARTR
jgi:hypothetical protein